MILRLPNRVKGCEGCSILIRNAHAARGDAANRQRVLSRHTNDDLTARYTEEYREFEARAELESLTYLAHHAEAHPIPHGQVALPPTDNDSAPSHRKPTVPPAAELAARLRAGDSIDTLAAEYERTPAVVRRRITMAGFHGVTGEPRTKHKAASGGLPTLAFNDRPWADDALCAQIGGDPWFPDKGTVGEHAIDNHIREAKAVCGQCPVRVACLTYALDNGERYGIWGGTTERERRKLKKAAS